MIQSGKRQELSVLEYIAQELQATERHEFINGQLYEIPGEKDINNQIAFSVALLLQGS